MSGHTYEEAMDIVREGLRAWCEPRGIGITAIKHERGYLVRVVSEGGSPFEAYVAEGDPEKAVTALVAELRGQLPSDTRGAPGHG